MSSGPLRASSGTIQSLLQPTQFWREHTNTPQILMRQPKRFSKSACCYVYKSPSTLSQPQSSQMIGPITGVELVKRH